MNKLIQALREIIQFLEKEKISYMIIGGIANSFYGNPRQTFDIDIKIDLDEQRVNGFIDQLSSVGTLAAEDPIAFLEETSVIPVDIDNVRIDLVRCRLPFEIEAIRRGERKNIFGLNVIVCTAEDLIIQKAVSVRDKEMRSELHAYRRRMEKFNHWEVEERRKKSEQTLLEEFLIPSSQFHI
jgi:hypothetical protein